MIINLKMRDEYSKLGKSLFFFYSTRLIVLIIIFYTSFGYFNDYYTHSYDYFHNSEGSLPFDRLVDVLESSSVTLKGITAMSQVVLEDGAQTRIGNYCTSNQSFTDC